LPAFNAGDPRSYFGVTRNKRERAAFISEEFPMVSKPVFAAVVAAACAHATVHAQVKSPAAQTGAPTELPPVVVTGNPLGSELFELVQPVSVLSGKTLFQLRRSTLGETLNGLPGVSATGFGPNASRPVIRGLDSDRVRILQNGTGVLDASSLSFDHAVAVDPMVVERAEVVRGPAALLYGGSAVGGVVNVIDNRIPQSAIQGVTGRGETRFGGAEREKASSVLIEAGNGRFALHADAYVRDTDDLKIKGANISPRLQAIDPARAVTQGTLPNSASRAKGGAVGASLTWDRGYAGLSYAGFDTHYGTVADPDVVIDMKNNRLDLAGELREISSFITGAKFKLGRTDYEHREIDLGVIGTTFRSRGYDSRVELTHAKWGPLKGALGLQLSDVDFSALGAEAFVPSTNTHAKALFLYEEAQFDKLKISFGARHERTNVRADGGGPLDPSTGNPRFDPPQTRNFNANSGSLGALWNFTPTLGLAVNGTWTERAPTFYELFANGAHVATAAYEVGNSAFGKEKSAGLEAALRLKTGAHSASISVFQNRYRNFVTLFNAGNTRGANGEPNPVDANGDGVADVSGAAILREMQYRAAPARFRGAEAEGKFRVLQQGASTLDLQLKFDYVQAEDLTTGLPLPRIAPRRFGAGLDYRRNAFGARLDVTHVARQSRVAANELPTDGHTLLNAAISYQCKTTQGNLEMFVRGVNLLNEDARNHVSFLKDIAPLGRRSGQVGMRAQF
jgi:iron complex outermembrane receptor protein